MKFSKVAAGDYESGPFRVVSVEYFSEGMDRGGWHLFFRGDYCQTFETKSDACAAAQAINKARGAR